MILDFESFRVDKITRMLIINSLYFIPFEDVFDLIKFSNRVRLVTAHGTYLLECKNGMERDFLFNKIQKAINTRWRKEKNFND